MAVRFHGFHGSSLSSRFQDFHLSRRFHGKGGKVGNAVLERLAKPLVFFNLFGNVILGTNHYLTETIGKVTAGNVEPILDPASLNDTPLDPTKFKTLLGKAFELVSTKIADLGRQLLSPGMGVVLAGLGEWLTALGGHHDVILQGVKQVSSLPFIGLAQVQVTHLQEAVVIEDSI
ncbi:MAG: hypothetical protein D6E12_12925 [Desulfovibrio sp.]|nr:MAG: hypothetical protein D6E12_12925 [Desulfovibrio sp.]